MITIETRHFVRLGSDCVEIEAPEWSLDGVNLTPIGENGMTVLLRILERSGLQFEDGFYAALHVRKP